MKKLKKDERQSWNIEIWPELAQGLSSEVGLFVVKLT